MEVLYQDGDGLMLTEITPRYEAANCEPKTRCAPNCSPACQPACNPRCGPNSAGCYPNKSGKCNPKLFYP